MKIILNLEIGSNYLNPFSAPTAKRFWMDAKDIETATISRAAYPDSIADFLLEILPKVGNGAKLTIEGGWIDPEKPHPRIAEGFAGSPILDLLLRSTDFDCDDCGNYQDDDLVASIGGKRVASFHKDGHMSSSRDDDLGTIAWKLTDILCALGHDAALRTHAHKPKTLHVDELFVGELTGTDGLDEVMSHIRDDAPTVIDFSGVQVMEPSWIRGFWIELDENHITAATAMKFISSPAMAHAASLAADDAPAWWKAAAISEPVAPRSAIKDFPW